MNRDMLILGVTRALSHACNPLTHLSLFDDGSGCIVVGFIQEHNNPDYIITFEPDDDIRELACEWFFEDYEPFDKRKQFIDAYTATFTKFDDDEPSQWDDLNKYMGGYA